MAAWRASNASQPERGALKEATRQLTKLLLPPPRSSKAGRFLGAGGIPVLLQLFGKKLGHPKVKSCENPLEMLSVKEQALGIPS